MYIYYHSIITNMCDLFTGPAAIVCSGVATGMVPSWHETASVTITGPADNPSKSHRLRPMTLQGFGLLRSWIVICDHVAMVTKTGLTARGNWWRLFDVWEARRSAWPDTEERLIRPNMYEKKLITVLLIVVSVHLSQGELLSLSYPLHLFHGCCRWYFSI